MTEILTMLDSSVAAKELDCEGIGEDTGSPVGDPF